MPNIHIPGTSINWNTNLVPGVNVSDAIHSSSSYQNPTPGSFYPTQTGSSSIPASAPVQPKVLSEFDTAHPNGSSTVNTPAAAPSDPFTAQQHSLQNSLPGQISNIYNSSSDAATTAGRSYGSSILDYISSLTAGQDKLNSQGVQNELSRKQGSQGVLDMVGRGIQSGGVTLANRNAGSSSATGALARAYALLGRTQQTSVNNQYVQGENTINQNQHAFDMGNADSVRHLGEGKQTLIDNVVQSAQGQLVNLDNQLVNASLPDRVAIEQEKARIRDNASKILSGYDPSLTSGISNVHPATVDQNRLTAQGLATAGTAPENQFNFTDQLPAQFQNTGPFSSSLPVFALPGSKKVTA